MKQYIYGKNTILEALKGDKSVYTVYVQNNAKDNGIIEQCKRKKIPFKIVDKSEFIKKLGNVSHQGVMRKLKNIAIIVLMRSSILFLMVNSHYY